MATEIPNSGKDKAPPKSPSKGIGGFNLDDVQNAIPGFVAGMLKGNTVDFLGLPVDIINETLGAIGLKSKQPVGGSDSLRSLAGIKPTAQDTSSEVGGSFVSPAGAAKAMIVGAARVLKKEGVATEVISKITQTAKDASAMEMSGVKTDVFNTTGAYATKADDVVRSVISDAKASLQPGILKTTSAKELVLAPGSAQLSDILRHDELFALYPELKDYKVRNSPDIKTASARHSPETRVMEFGPQRSPEDFLSVILHETQHAVQNAEGMQAGASVKDFLKLPRPSMDRLLKVKESSKSSDTTLAEPAKKFLNIINADYKQAFNKYSNVPGETEARFTQENRGMSQTELSDHVSKLISEDVPNSLWAK